MRYPVVLTPDLEDGGFVAECPVIPGCVSEGDTVEETLANIRDAIEGSRIASLPRSPAGVVISWGAGG